MKTPPGTPRAQQRKPTAQRLATDRPRSRRAAQPGAGHRASRTRGTPEYARYQGLLPQILAPTVAPGSADMSGSWRLLPSGTKVWRLIKIYSARVPTIKAAMDRQRTWTTPWG
jgi:hypothetical protein